MAQNQRRTKILFVITKSNFGGAQKYVFDLATGLSRNEFEVAVILGGKGILTDNLRNANIRTIGVPTLLRDVSPIKDIKSFFVLWKLFRDEQPDVVHLNSAKVSGLGALAARFAGVSKIIFTAHGWAFNEERSTPERLVIKFLSWITVLLSHKTIAVSEAVKNDTRKWPFVREKIITIKNGINESELSPRILAREHLFAQAGAPISHDAFVIGTIAELHKNKGLSYAIEAFAKLSKENPTLYYFILGEGEGKESLSSLLSLYGLQGRVFLFGFVKDAARFLPAFDLFLLPSVKEGLPYVLLEAGLARLPVIATKIGGIPEIIENKKTGLLVPPREPDAILESIKLLKNDSNLAKHFGESLRERVLTEFSLGRTIRDTMVLYTKD